MGKNELFDLFQAGTDALGLSLSDTQWNQFERFYHELELFNDVYRLVNARGEELIVKHFLDSLAPAKILKDIMGEGDEEFLCADIGSGGGFPAIPLSILFESTRWDLIERSGKRCGFLLNAVAACNLQDRLSVLHKDLKDISSQYHMVTFRAVSSLADVLVPLDRIVAPGGAICAYKGKASQVREEMKMLSAEEKDEKSGRVGGYSYHVHDVNAPLLDSERTLAVLRKDAR